MLGGLFVAFHLGCFHIDRNSTCRCTATRLDLRFKLSAAAWRCCISSLARLSASKSSWLKQAACGCLRTLRRATTLSAPASDHVQTSSLAAPPEKIPVDSHHARPRQPKTMKQLNRSSTHHHRRCPPLPDGVAAPACGAVNQKSCKLATPQGMREMQLWLSFLIRIPRLAVYLIEKLKANHKHHPSRLQTTILACYTATLLLHGKC